MMDAMSSSVLIAFEGIDGAGKRTQTRRLEERAAAAGLKAASVSFPRYRQTLAAAAIEDYLSGSLGDIASVPPRFAAAMYALDRYESLEHLRLLLAGHDLVVVDRYVASNLAYQGARIPEARREDFIRWLFALEHRVLGLPLPDLTIFLDVPVDLAARRIGRRREGGEAAVSADIYEQSQVYLEQCRETYRFVARLGLYRRWVTVDGGGDGGGESGRPRAGGDLAGAGRPGQTGESAGDEGLDPDAVAARIWTAVEGLLQELQERKRSGPAGA